MMNTALAIPPEILKRIENRKAIHHLAKYGNPLFPLAGETDADRNKYVIYADYNFLENEGIFKWLVHNFKLFPCGVKYDLFGMEFIVLKIPKSQKVVYIPEKVLDMWLKPLTTYVESHKLK